MIIKPPRNFSSRVAILSIETVRLIRRESRLEPNMPAVHWARRFGVSAESIRKVLRYETWGWVPDDEELSMIPSESVSLHQRQLEEKLEALHPELSPESIKAAEARALKLMKELEQQKTDPYAGFSAAMIERLVGYGNITREEADRILAARAAKSS